MASQDIIDFMLRGKKAAASDRPDPSPGGVPETRPINSGSKNSASKSSSPSPRKAAQQQQHAAAAVQQSSAACKAFARNLVDWLETDETAHQVVRSLANLRERIWHTSKLLLLLLLRRGGAVMALRRQNHHPRQENSKQQQQHGFYGYGYRWDRGRDTATSSTLNADDLEMALDHDLQQHERMLVQLRRVLSALGLTQEALSRRVDELYRVEIMTENYYYYSGSGGLLSSSEQQQQQRVSSISLADCHGLFTATAKELYRKQMLAEQVLESATSDGLFYRDDDDDRNNEEDEGGEDVPRRIAHRCSTQWSRTDSAESHLIEYAALLQEMLQNAK